ncbi:MAG: alpha/beta hydrolase [Planctomycetes bacterium]|nr:alpha/beta hydrolase [Planctomycetota bacterium]
MRQLPVLFGDKSPENFIPEKPWALVTWSMGTWTGLNISLNWHTNPPKFWLALSPFIRFMGEGCRVSEKEFQLLQKSFRRRPEATLEHFCHQHKGMGKWFQGDKIDEGDKEDLDHSLSLLSQKLQTPPALDLPMKALYGEEDLLVTKPMVREFADLFSQYDTIPLKGLSHALLYEEPQAVGTELKKLLHSCNSKNEI